MARTKQTARAGSMQQALALGMPIEMHRAQPMGVTQLMYVGDSGDGLGDAGSPNLMPWVLLGGALLVAGLLLGSSK